MALVQKSIVAVGAALVDLLVRVEHQWLEQNGVVPGGMELSDPRRLDLLLGSISAQPEQVPGGSSCNTLVGTAQLGVRSRFVGRLGRDERGDFFRNALLQSGVEGELIFSDEPTGTVLSVITPDAQRSMFTSLGASAGLVPSDLRPDLFRGFDLLYLEGYLAPNEGFFREVYRLAQLVNTPVSLDLASFQTVQAAHALFDEMLPLTTILIANEDEARAFTGKEPGEALEELARRTPIAVVKLGKEGALIARGGERVRVKAKKVQAIDTTGAGDLWASGFLTGWLKGDSLATAGELGARCAAEVVQRVGAHLPPSVWSKIGSDDR